MTAWTRDELARVGDADELRIASRRPDGSLRPYVTIWAVRVGDDIYVRSAYGYDNPWFQRALLSAEGRIRAGAVERDVAFEVPAPEVADGITAAYHSKYDHHGREDRGNRRLAGGRPVDAQARAPLSAGRAGVHAARQSTIGHRNRARRPCTLFGSRWWAILDSNQ